jgi:hypothetical protein
LLILNVISKTAIENTNMLDTIGNTTPGHHNLIDSDNVLGRLVVGDTVAMVKSRGFVMPEVCISKNTERNISPVIKQSVAMA